MKTGNLVIHDLDPAEWEKISGDYSGWNVVTDNGSIHPCIPLYVWIANTNWNRTSRENGIKPKDMFTRDI